MSDYVKNQEYSMQLAARGDDPYAYDWSSLRAAVDEPLPYLFGEMAPADRTQQSSTNLTEPMSNEDAQCSSPHEDARKFSCDYLQCDKTYKSQGDLNRHKKSHGDDRIPCAAHGCSKTFERNDHLLKHTLRGHDETETPFSCPWASCAIRLTKDILTLHGYWFTNKYKVLDKHHQCPVPKCRHKIEHHMSQMHKMQEHLRSGHHLASALNLCKDVLASKGYDHDSIKILCPICPPRCLFEGHREFAFHFLEKHCLIHTDRAKLSEYVEPPSHWDWTKVEWGTVTSEQRKHRRTILSVYPAFRYHPVWADIRSECGQN